MRLNLERIVRLAGGALILGATSLPSDLSAQSLIGDTFPATLHQFEAPPNSHQLIGTYQLSGNHISPAFCRSPESTIYGIGGVWIGQSLGLYRFDAQSGAATLLHQLDLGSPQFFLEVAGAAVHPMSKDIYFLLDTTVLRVNPATGQFSPLPTPLPGSGKYRGLAFDSAGQLFTFRGSFFGSFYDSLWSVDLDSPALSTPIGSLGITIPDPLLAYDAVTHRLLGYNPGLGDSGDSLFEIDPISGLAGTIVDMSADGLIFTSFIGDACEAKQTYGQGCSGSSISTPELRIIGCPIANQPITVDIRSGIGGSTALLCVGLTSASIPLGDGCDLLIQPPLPIILPVPLGGIGPGSGAASIPAFVPAQASGASLAIQAFIIDSASPIGASSTNGIAIDIP